MSRRGDAIDRGRARMVVRAPNHLSDLCSFVGPGTETRDAFGEVTTTDGSISLSVPCEYQAMSTYERQAGGAVTQNATHRLKVPATTAMLALSGTARGTIAARGLSPALSFEVTGRLDSSAGLFLNLAIVMR